MDDHTESLPSDLLMLARSLQLSVTAAGEVIHTSSIGAGFDLDHWLVCMGGDLFVEITLTRADDAGQPIGQMQMLLSDAIDHTTAQRLLRRWSTLQEIEAEHDGQHDSLGARQQRIELTKALFARLRNDDTPT